MTNYGPDYNNQPIPERVEQPDTNTHPEQESLREKIYKLLVEDQATAVQETFIGDLQEYETDEIMHLIEQDREQAVREAEMKAWDKGHEDCFNYHVSEGAIGSNDNPYTQERSK